jgi:hypothetical protein
MKVEVSIKILAALTAAAVLMSAGAASALDKTVFASGADGLFVQTLGIELAALYAGNVSGERARRLSPLGRLPVSSTMQTLAPMAR